MNSQQRRLSTANLSAVRCTGAIRSDMAQVRAGNGDEHLVAMACNSAPHKIARRYSRRNVRTRGAFKRLIVYTIYCCPIYRVTVA